LPERGSSNRPAFTIVVAALELAAAQIRIAKAAIRLITRLSLLRPGRESRPDGGDEPVPAVRFFLQPLPSLASQLIIFGPTIVVRFIPFRREQALAHQAEEGWIERALFDQKRAFGNLADSKKDPVAVERTEGNRFQNEKVKRARKKFGLVTHRVPLSWLGD